MSPNSPVGANLVPEINVPAPAAHSRGGARVRFPPLKTPNHLICGKYRKIWGLAWVHGNMNYHSGIIGQHVTIIFHCENFKRHLVFGFQRVPDPSPWGEEGWRDHFTGAGAFFNYHLVQVEHIFKKTTGRTHFKRKN